MPTFAEAKLIPAMDPWLTPSLEAFLQAAGVMFDPISEVLEGGTEGTPIWGKILDPTQFPEKYNPQYLAQFAGVVIPPGTPFAEAIALIVEDVARRRGTPTLILSEAQRALAPGATARLIERTNVNHEEDAYHFLIACRAKDVQGALTTTGNVKATEAKVKSLPSIVGIEIGDQVVALGLPSGTTVTAVGSGEVTVSAEATVTATGTSVVFVPQAGLQLVRNGVDGVKSGGVLWTLVTGATWAQLEEEWATWAEVEAHYATWAQLELEA